MMKALLLFQVKTEIRRVEYEHKHPRNLGSYNPIHNAREYKTHSYSVSTYILDVGKIKHSPDESKILWGPPHESNHPVQYSITIFG